MTIKTVYKVDDGTEFEVFMEAVVYETLVKADEFYMDRYEAIQVAKFIVTNFITKEIKNETE